VSHFEYIFKFLVERKAADGLKFWIDNIPACCNFSANISIEFLESMQASVDLLEENAELKKIFDELKVKVD
jgi:hypothetical protein